MKTRRLSRRFLRKFKIISLVLIVLIIIAIPFLILHSYKENIANQREYENYVQKVDPLYEQLNEFKKELSILEEKFELTVVPKATVQIIFTELDQRVYDVCYNSMKQRDLKGVLALSNNEFPGENGCMSIDQFKELLDAGWSTCFLVEDYANVSNDIAYVSEKLENLDIEIPNTLYIANGLNSFEIEFESGEYDIVIYEGANNSSVIQTSVETKIWYLGAVGLRSSYAKRLLNEAVVYRGNLAFLVGYTKNSQMYNTDYFINMLDEVELHADNEDLIVCSPSYAKEHFLERKTSKTQEEIEQYNVKRKELEEEIKNIQQKIEEAYFETQ